VYVWLTDKASGSDDMELADGGKSGSDTVE
jgi:hypothetical protein